MLDSQNILTVSQLTSQIKKSLEDGFSDIIVTGELSNFKAHVSGHWYFSMKDSGASVSCTMWKGMNSYVFFTPQDGMNITAHGRITVYPPRGQYQLEVRSMRPAGIGELQQAFELLKKKLSAEGLFDAAHKKDIPSFPVKIGVITAPDGAAMQDLRSVAARRYPVAELVLAPSKVQGAGAAENISACIEALNWRDDIDVIIIARGGGSIEDLWAFNEEIVARSIYASRIPVITGIGHEIDFTIADFTADLRAATPTAAMEIATPDRNDLFAFIGDFSYNSTQRIMDIRLRMLNKIKTALNSYGFRMPLDIIKHRNQLTDHLYYKISRGIEKIIMLKEKEVLRSAGIIKIHDVQHTLKRGFVLVKQNSGYVKRARDLDTEAEILLKFSDNEVLVNK